MRSGIGGIVATSPRGMYSGIHDFSRARTSESSAARSRSSQSIASSMVWPASCDLLPEARNHTACAAEDIAKAHDHELRAAVLQALADDFGEALGRAHHIGRIDGLVG